MKNIVTIGGGTGSYVVLSGLRNIPNISISALVSMSDNGGSTGVLRDELGVLPPGDVRQCLVALSDHSDIVRNLMNYRFTDGSLSGHSFGNIFLAGLEKVTGDFASGVRIASEILKVKGRVIPITNDKAELDMILKDDTLVEGQVNITNTDIQKVGIKNIFYKENVHLSEEAKDAIKKADYIIIGPGDYYSSVLPNVIVNQFKDVLKESNAKIILPINLTNKQGHTLHWKSSDYLNDIESWIDKKVDIILINNEKPSDEQIEVYQLKEGDGVLVENNIENDDRVIFEALVSHSFFMNSSKDIVKRSFIRHDSLKIGSCISKLIGESKKKVIFDFDDTLLDNSKLKEVLYRELELAGVTREITESKYKEMRQSDEPFSLKTFLSYLIKKEDIDNIYNKIINTCPDLLNKEMIEIIKNLGKYNCYIVSNGERQFQEDKIKSSGIYGLFCEVIILPGSKKQVIERICDQNKDSKILFIDDKEQFFNDLDFEKCSNLKKILCDKDGLQKLKGEIN